LPHICIKYNKKRKEIASCLAYLGKIKTLEEKLWFGLTDAKISRHRKYPIVKLEKPFDELGYLV
jgi:hypothetical protein